MAKKENERSKNKKRKKRKYGQAKLKHAKKGLISCGIAASVFLSLTILLAIAYVSKGAASGYIGGLGMITMISTVIGIYNAIKGFKEREKDYTTCKIGLGCNIVFLLGFVAIFLRGVF